MNEWAASVSILGQHSGSGQSYAAPISGLVVPPALGVAPAQTVTANTPTVVYTCSGRPIVSPASAALGQTAQPPLFVNNVMPQSMYSGAVSQSTVVPSLTNTALTMPISGISSVGPQVHMPTVVGMSVGLPGQPSAAPVMSGLHPAAAVQSKNEVTLVDPVLAGAGVSMFGQTSAPLVRADGSGPVTASSVQGATAMVTAVSATHRSMTISQPAGPSTACTLTQPIQVTSSVATTTVASSPAIPAVAAAPVIVVRQYETVRPYSGTTSWKSFKDHFMKVAKVNNWATQAEKVLHLSLSLEGQAAEILKDIDDTASTAFDDIWSALRRRFGSLDEPRDAMRRFDQRNQSENESIAEFEQSLRTLHREAWPSATAEQRDLILKRRFEDGLAQPEMIRYLRLHARNDDFASTVMRARWFAEASAAAKPKKSVRFVNSPSHDTSTINALQTP